MQTRTGPISTTNNSKFMTECHSLLYLREPSTLTWELRTGESKTTLEDKTKAGNVTLYIVRKPKRC